jgi:hypothetical protein
MGISWSRGPQGFQQPWLELLIEGSYQPIGLCILPKRFMKMLSSLENRAAAYACLEVLKVDPVTARVCTPGWDITFTANVPQKGITMKMKSEFILGQQLAVQADGFLDTIESPVSWLLVVELSSENKIQQESATYVPQVNTPLSTVTS